MNMLLQEKRRLQFQLNAIDTNSAYGPLERNKTRNELTNRIKALGNVIKTL